MIKCTARVLYCSYRNNDKCTEQVFRNIMNCVKNNIKSYTENHIEDYNKKLYKNLY